MRRIYLAWGAVICLCLLFNISTADAQSGYPDYVDLYVNDYANILSNDEESRIRNRLIELKNSTDVEVTVLTVDSFKAYNTGDSSFEAFATNLFNTWGIGDAERNDGILLFIAMEERMVRIETGVGWENQLQSDTRRIVDDVILPRLRDGNPNLAMINGANAIASEVDFIRNERGSTQTRIDNSSSINESQAEAAIVPTRSPFTGGTSESTSNGDNSNWFTIFVSSIVGILGIGGAGTGAYFLSRPPKCPHCEQPLHKLGEHEEDVHLTEGQQLEERLGSVNYNVWVCNNDDYLTVKHQTRWFSGYSGCPSCAYKAVSTSTKTLQHATRHSTGLQEITKNCRHCDYQSVSTSVLPRIQDNDHDSGSSFGGSSGGGSFGGGSSSGGGSSGSW